MLGVMLKLQLGYIPFDEWLAFDLAGNSVIVTVFVREWKL